MPCHAMFVQDPCKTLACIQAKKTSSSLLLVSWTCHAAEIEKEKEKPEFRIYIKCVPSISFLFGEWVSTRDIIMYARKDTKRTAASIIDELRKYEEGVFNNGDLVVLLGVVEYRRRVCCCWWWYVNLRGRQAGRQLGHGGWVQPQIRFRCSSYHLLLLSYLEEDDGETRHLLSSR